MLWRKRFPKLIQIGVCVSLISRENPLLSVQTPLNDALRHVPRGQFEFVPPNLQVFILGSPAEHTLLGAVIKRRGHLETLVRFYPVELLLVTVPVVDEGLV